MIRVLFVCLGNICRSPLAEAVMKKKVSEAGLDDRIETDSCGTSNYHIGEQPDPRTLKNASKNEVCIEHQARQFDVKDFDRFHYILAMDRANYRVIMELDEADSFSDKVFLMREFDHLEKGADVPDPYFGGEEGFQHVFDILDRSVNNFLEHIKTEHKIIK